jgi:hypothetical protein
MWNGTQSVYQMTFIIDFYCAESNSMLHSVCTTDTKHNIFILHYRYDIFNKGDTHTHSPFTYIIILRINTSSEIPSARMQESRSTPFKHTNIYTLHIILNDIFCIYNKEEKKKMIQKRRPMWRVID